MGTADGLYEHHLYPERLCIPQLHQNRRWCDCLTSVLLCSLMGNWMWGMLLLLQRQLDKQTTCKLRLKDLDATALPGMLTDSGQSLK